MHEQLLPLKKVVNWKNFTAELLFDSRKSNFRDFYITNPISTYPMEVISVSQTFSYKSTKHNERIPIFVGKVISALNK